MKEDRFTFERGRGVVWVCDVHNSSKCLNDNKLALDIEAYLPRLHWLAKIAVSLADGQFVKWTGDGFLAWFPIELHRELGSRSPKVIQMIWHLSAINNITGLGIEGETRFRLRHGLTMEHDALITKVFDGKADYFDLIGRSVVLAFRLSSISANFPGIVTQREIVEATAKENVAKIKFRKLSLTEDDRLKHFKGERWGTTNLFASAEKKPRVRTKSAVLRSAKKTIADIESPKTTSAESVIVAQQLVAHLQTGPQWAREVLEDYTEFLQEDMLGTIKKLVIELEEAKETLA